jgi:hypothetical protein
MSTSHRSSDSTSDPEDAWLEKLLRRDEPAAASAARDDDSTAFTARVLAALPPPPAAVRRRAGRQRAFVIGGATALGAIIAWLCGGEAMVESLHEVMQVAQSAPSWLQAAESVVAGAQDART